LFSLFVEQNATSSSFEKMVDWILRNYLEDLILRIIIQYIVINWNAPLLKSSKKKYKLLCFIRLLLIYFQQVKKRKRSSVIYNLFIFKENIQHLKMLLILWHWCSFQPCMRFINQSYITMFTNIVIAKLTCITHYLT